MVLAGPRGFEPRTPGLEGLVDEYGGNCFYHSNGSLANKGMSGNFIVLPEAKKFFTWLSRQVEKTTLRDYERYFNKLPKVIKLEKLPKIVKNKWYKNLLFKIAEFLWETGRISFEEKERIKALVKRSLKKKPERKRVKSEIVSIEDYGKTLEFLKEHKPIYGKVYEIMYYSGARLEEAAYFLSNIRKFHRKLPQKEYKAIGYVDLDSAVRINIHYNRGRKRCEHLWLPKQLFQTLKTVKITAREITDYAKKHGLLRPKYVRKLNYQVLEDLIDDVTLRDFLQNRYYRLTIGDLNYGKMILRADRTYCETILPKLKHYTEGKL